jgi:mannose-6-phosphate isomerase-like protein (cupin superfamily)
MRTLVGIMLCIFPSLAFTLAFSQTPPPMHSATTMPLACGTSDCPLLKGMPQTAGLRSGYVRLTPGESVGWHTTGKNEETLIILHGKGEARIEGSAGMPVAEHMVAYIPPATRHNVKNTGTELLEYVYVVAPAAEK